LGTDRRFYENVGALPLDSTSTFIRSLPAPTPTGPIIMTSGVATLTLRDSAGRPLTVQFPDRSALPPVVPNSVGAFVSGIASIKATLDAFARGELRSYPQVTALTKTDGWK
jgi:hypothetical protein